jgi:hypothetical protein
MRDWLICISLFPFFKVKTVNSKERRWQFLVIHYAVHNFSLVYISYIKITLIYMNILPPLKEGVYYHLSVCTSYVEVFPVSPPLEYSGICETLVSLQFLHLLDSR